MIDLVIFVMLAIGAFFGGLCIGHGLLAGQVAKFNDAVNDIRRGDHTEDDNAMWLESHADEFAKVRKTED